MTASFAAGPGGALPFYDRRGVGDKRSKFNERKYKLNPALLTKEKDGIICGMFKS